MLEFSSSSSSSKITTITKGHTYIRYAGVFPTQPEQCLSPPHPRERTINAEWRRLFRKWQIIQQLTLQLKNGASKQTKKSQQTPCRQKFHWKNLSTLAPNLQGENSTSYFCVEGKRISIYNRGKENCRSFFWWQRRIVNI